MNPTTELSGSGASRFKFEPIHRAKKIWYGYSAYDG